ncbi:unnamed protein product, partial [Mesorhabditis spiculigera]
MKRKDRRESEDVKPSTSSKNEKEPASKKGRKSKGDKENHRRSRRSPSEDGFDAKEYKTSYFLPLTKLNDHITCQICKGYLIDATTVIECLHTFCKSCLLKHFEDKDNNCPQYVAEEKRRRYDFLRRQNKKQGIIDEPMPGKKEEVLDVGPMYKCYQTKPEVSHHRQGDQTMVELSPSPGLGKIGRNIVRLHFMATINLIKRYLALCLWNDVWYQRAGRFLQQRADGQGFLDEVYPYDEVPKP